MQKYTIHNRTSGALFGEAVAASETEALDLIARDQGYRDYTDLCDVIGISVEDGRDDLDIRVEPVILIVDGGLAATSDTPPVALADLADYVAATVNNLLDDGPDAVVDWDIVPLDDGGLPYRGDGVADRYDVTYRWRDETGEVSESNEPLLTLRPLACDGDVAALVWAAHTVQAGQLPTVTDINERGEGSLDFVALHCDAATLASLIKAAESYPATYERRAVRSILKTLKAR